MVTRERRIKMFDWDIEDYSDDEEDQADDSSGEELECIECGKTGYAIPGEEERPFMCCKCKSMWK